MRIVSRILLCAANVFDQKPQDISEALSRSTFEHLDILASLCVLEKRHMNSEAAFLRYYGTRDVTLQKQELQTANKNEDEQSHQVVVIDNRPSTKTTRRWPMDQRQANTVCELVEGQALHSLIGPESYGSPRYLSAKDVRRWNCLAKLLSHSDMQEAANKLVFERNSVPVANKNILSPLHNQDNVKTKLGVSVSELLRYTNPQIVDSLVSRQHNFTFMSEGLRLRGAVKFLVSWYEDLLLLLMLIILPIAYGGIHLAAWNFKFASKTEGLLWKVACIDIMTTTPAIVAFALTIKYAIIIFMFLPPVDSIIWEVNFLSVFVLTLFYLLSRLFLLVESFISLRHVPIGVYATLPWVQNIPHL